MAPFIQRLILTANGRVNCFYRIIEDQGNSADSLSRLQALTTPLTRPPSSTYVFVILSGSGLYDAT